MVMSFNKILPFDARTEVDKVFELILLIVMTIGTITHIYHIQKARRIRIIIDDVVISE